VHGLLVTRSFGDLKARLPELGGTADGIINEPFMQVLDVDTSVVSSILVCSDGITDPLLPADRYSFSQKSKKNVLSQYLLERNRNKNLTQINKPGEIFKIRTGNVAKYAVGQAVQGMGPKKQSGVVLSVEPDVEGATTGGGKLRVEAETESVDDEACRHICELSCESSFWAKKNAGSDNSTVVYIHFE
jgi:hypothetical protein